MSNEGFHEVHIWCDNPVKLARLKRRAPDLRLKADCDPANAPSGSTCYEYPAGREAEFEKAARMGRPPIRFEWGIGGVNYAACFALGDLLFAVNDFPALQIWNIADPTSPVSLASLTLENSPQAIWITNGACFVADNGGFIYCIDIDDPAAPFVEPNGIAQTGENWSHLRAIGDIGVLSGAGASNVALYDLGIRPPRLIQDTDTIVGSQACFQGRRLFFGDSTGSPRAMLRNYRLGGQFCPIMHTYDLYAETQVTAELVRARHGHFAGEVVADSVTAAGRPGDEESGSVTAYGWFVIGPYKIGWVIGDPNGVVSAPQGSILLGDTQSWRNSDGTDSGWV